MSDSVTELRLDHQEEKMQELKASIEKLNDTIGQMTRTFIAAQVCEQRVSKIEGDLTDTQKAIAELVGLQRDQSASIASLGELLKSQADMVKSHEVTVSEVKRLKQVLIGGIGLSALVNPTAQGALKRILEALAGQ